MREHRPTLYALLGDPVAHSRSPRLHNAAFQALGIDARYVTRRVNAGRAPRLLRALAAAGGGGNVTLPHKQRIVAALDAPTPAVLRTGACNTFWAGPQGVHGDNTDVEGFAAAAAVHDLELRGARVLLLGAGGGAAAVLAALTASRAAAVTILNRSPAPAAELARRFADSAVVRVAGAVPPGALDLVVNATSLGLHATDAYPLPLEQLPPACAVFDLVYAPGGTAWVRAARAAGRPAFDGSEMLLRQAAAAFQRWTGREPPLEVMRNALFSRPGD